MIIVKVITGLLALTVAVVLALGLRNMMKNGDAGMSQKLMRMRIGVQFITIGLVMTTLYVFG